jgi:structural maintenance of chromosome 2
MQGRITKVLNMKPQEILGLIEEAAGTRMFELKKQQAVKTIEKKQTKLGEIDKVFEEDLTPRLEKLGSERAEYLEYKKSEQDVETLSRVCQAHDYFSSERAQQKCTEATEAGKARQAELAAAIEQAEQDKVAKKEQKARALSKKTEDGAGEMKTLESEESELSKQLVKLGAEHGQLESTAEADSATAKGLEQTITDTEKAQTKARAELKKAEAASAKAQAVHSERAQALQTKREQYEAQMGIATASGDGAKDLQGQLSEAEANLSTSVTAQKTAGMRLKHLVKEVKDAEKKFKDASKSGTSEQTDGAALQKDVASLRTKMGRLDYDETQEVALGTDQHKQQSEHARLCKEAEAVSASVGGLEFRYNPPSRDFDRRRVKGTIASNLRVKDPAHATALEALAGGRLHHVVVDDEQTGMLLLTEGGLQRRVTLIPLSKIQCAPPNPPTPPQPSLPHLPPHPPLPRARARTHRTHPLRARAHTRTSAYPTWVRRAIAPGLPLLRRPRVISDGEVNAAKKLVGANKVHLATSLFDCESALQPAMNHVFGGTLVCSDKEAAREVCEKIKQRTVTLEGDLYDPKGTLTGGSRAKSGASILCRLGQLAELRQKLSAREESLATLAAQVETCRKSGEEMQRMQAELELKEHQLHLHTQSQAASQSGQAANNLQSLKQQLEEQVELASSSKQAAADAKEQRDALAAQLSDFEGNKDERMAQAKATIATLETEVKSALKALQAQQHADQKLTMQLEEMGKDIASAREQLEEFRQRFKQDAKEIEKSSAAVDKKKAQFDAAAAKLQQQRETLGKYDEEVQSLNEACEALDKVCADGAVELKQLEVRLTRDQKEQTSAADTCRELLKRHPWMETERARFGVAGGEFDFAKRKPAAMRDALSKQLAQLESLSKRINKKVLSMFEKAEQEYADLMSKKEIVLQDKAKIEAVISELGQKKIEALQKTWAKVNTDFGSIFSTLLAGANAKLEPQEGCQVEDGLVVKVGFGKVWKQSLTELSGGQRSLVALSLVLSLLRFKPAPIYILDEVDAALDLSHTQNIGAMIRTHFKQSQFLVVSLKEGMFNNANVLFRTKFVDGVSTVSRTVPAMATARENEGKGKQQVAANRKALTAMN